MKALYVHISKCTIQERKRHQNFYFFHDSCIIIHPSVIFFLLWLWSKAEAPPSNSITFLKLLSDHNTLKNVTVCQQYTSCSSDCPSRFWKQVMWPKDVNKSVFVCSYSFYETEHSLSCFLFVPCIILQGNVMATTLIKPINMTARPC